MTSPADFARRIHRCWSAETASTYTVSNPALGQCSVTSLVAQDHLGGDIVKTRVGKAWHFYNRIDDARFDFTASQFDGQVGYDDLPSSRDDAFSDTTLAQYETLSRAFACLR